MKQLKDSVRIKFIAPHNNLNKLFDFTIVEVSKRTYYFNRKDKEEVNKQIDAITLDDMIEAANALLKKELHTLVTAKPHQEEYNKHRPAVQSIDEIQKNAEYYEENINKST